MPASAQEQYLLELINEARLNPAANAARYLSSYAPLTSSDPAVQAALNFFGVSGPALQAAFAALSPARPLAWSDPLATAARNHNAAMIAADQQTHQAPGEADLGARANASGYVNWSTLGENVFAYSENLLYAHAGFMVDWGQGPNGMQDPPGHRQSIMSPSFREVGIGVAVESNPSTRVGPLVVTEDFGARFSNGSFILGVAYADTNGDGFYTPGEGNGSLTVSLGGAAATSAPAGGYQLETFATGAQAVVFSGGGLGGAVGVSLTLGVQSNVKIDIVNGGHLKTSASAAVSGPVSIIEGLGTQGLTLVAVGATPHTIAGTVGADSLDGGSGRDTVMGGAGADFVRALDGDDAVHGGDGADDVNGNVGQDVVRGEGGMDWVRGGQGADLVFGGADDDPHVNGNLGEDEAYGGTGNDSVYGGQGNDTLYGEDGADWLSGDLGDDIVYGGAGADRFLFRPGAGVDWVGDFSSAGGDRIQLAPGVGYSIVTVSGQAVVQLADGARIGLAGVAPEQMGDWLIFA